MTLNIRPTFLAAAILTVAAHLAFAADPQESAAEKQRKLISVLQSDAPPQDKAITCKKLAIYGGKEAVPVLAPLLADEKLASWARIALEAIPDPSVDDALREAVGKLQGRLLIGVINTLGVRRDAKAVGVLAAKLGDANSEVACAAAEALGHIGDAPATQALTRILATAPENVRSAVAYGCILCAEKLLVSGQRAAAAKLYDTIRQTSLPKQRVLEATRGAILARQAEGIPLLLEQLRSKDKLVVGIALRTARELTGAGVAEALAAELDRATPERQVPLFLALTDRKDAAVLPKVLQVAKTGPKEIRTLALGMLDRFRDATGVAVLLDAAADADVKMAKTARDTLARLGGKEVDSDLVARIPKASGKTRQVLMELAKQRRIAEALPAALQCVDDADPGVRRAALDTVGVLGSDAEAAGLVRQLGAAKTAEVRDNIERALLAICGRVGAPCVPHVLPLAKHADGALRTIALHALASVGGAEALAAVAAAVNDQDAAIQDEAVRTLSEWPGNWPKDSAVAAPLLALAKSGKKTSHQVQGMRGYLKYIQETKDLDNESKLARVAESLALMKRPEEKQLAVSVISTIPTAGALESLVGFANDATVSEEACLAITRLATGNNQRDLPKDGLRKALQTAIEKTKSDATRKKAQDALKRVG